jgi:hypothetical protein
MLRSLLLTATAAAALHGPGPIQSLGTAQSRIGAKTVISDGARYVAFPRSATLLGIYDARRRRTFTVDAGCTRSVLAARTGLFLLQCHAWGPEAVVVDARTRKVHPIDAKFSDADGATVVWTGLDGRYARYQTQYDCNPIECGGGTYVINWRTGTARSVKGGFDCCPHPPLARLRLRGGPVAGVHGGDLWLLDGKTGSRKRLSRDCFRRCDPHLAGGWATWIAGFDPPQTVQAYNVTTHARRSWKVAGAAPVEQARVGRSLVVSASTKASGPTRLVSLVRLR